jgi:hypothetical protein
MNRMMRGVLVNTKKLKEMIKTAHIQSLAAYNSTSYVPAHYNNFLSKYRKISYDNM